MENDILTVEEAAELLKTSRNMIYKLIEENLATNQTTIQVIKLSPCYKDYFDS